MEAGLEFNISKAHDCLTDLCIKKRIHNKEDAPLPRLSSPDQYRIEIQELASLALDPKFTTLILCCYGPVFADIVSIWLSGIATTSKFDILIALAQVVALEPYLSVFADMALQKEQEVNTLWGLVAQDLERQSALLLAFLRLMKTDNTAFRRYIHIPSVQELLSKSPEPSIRYLAAEILGSYYQAAEAAQRQMIASHIDISQPILGKYDHGVIDFLFLNFFEAGRIKSGIELRIKCAAEQSNTPNSFDLRESSLSNYVSNIGGVLLPLESGKELEQISSKLAFVPTSTSQPTLKSIASALRSRKPILLSGISGAGKTLYIDELAKQLGRDKSLIRIHLGDQTDAKMLVGTYSTGDKPGTFLWRPGVLTVAVTEGRWVLIEDIDRAPTETLSILLPLLEKRELLVPSRGHTFKAKRGFQLIATTSTNQDMIGKRLWAKTKVEPPNSQDLVSIIAQRFPLLERLAEKFVETFSCAQNVFTSPQFNNISRSIQTRQVNTRDLMKWARRVEKILVDRHITNSSTSLPSHIYEDIFAEALDCFGAFLATLEAKKYLAVELGSILEISPSWIELYLKNHVPISSESSSKFSVGRARLSVSKKLHNRQASDKGFANTGSSLRLMEQIGVAVSMNEPLLLVGETGTGKTTVVQHLAKMLNKRLTVINMSQQTESSDILGGYKPIDAKIIAVPLRETFETLFEATFSNKKNQAFIESVAKYFIKNRWGYLIRLWSEASRKAARLLEQTVPPEKKRKLDEVSRKSLLVQWQEFESQVTQFATQIGKGTDNENGSPGFLFSFVEGPLVQAVRRGDWVLLDEVNLASPDTLESISDLLIQNASITLSEKGDAEVIRANSEFRLFACMNPATDVGKRDLPAGLRSRFSEVYVQSPDSDITDLLLIIDKYTGGIKIGDERAANDIAQLYLEAKQLSLDNKIVDGANQRPHFSIRTLCRTLSYVSGISHIYGLRRSLYEGFCMSFLTLLDQRSSKILLPIIEKYTVAGLKNPKSVLSQTPAPPKDGHNYIPFHHYWIRTSSTGISENNDSKYIITPSVEANLMNLIRATSSRQFPVLIQGPTSSGKTSMIRYLAAKTGHKFVRINNHEHTDLQEYLGTYVSNEQGKLAFQEGVLIDALRNGYWIVLDELNLAPTDVLEALNRLLDDNREILIPETQEIVRPHPDFMLFATQNPPGLYGGRKILSRAFRNRFLELHFDDLPEAELETILRERCQIAPSYSKKIVEVYRELSVQRQATRVFEQKNGFATLRDLFRWAGRESVGYEQLAANGFMLLAERARREEERQIVKKTIEKVMRVDIDLSTLYDGKELTRNSSVVWTKGMKRLATLVSDALKYNEPVLLVGETGCGKTTICQVLADETQKQLHIVNAHQNTETGDIIGAQRPVRRSQIQEELQTLIYQVFPELASETLLSLADLLIAYDSKLKPEGTEHLQSRIKEIQERIEALFQWSDGSLVQAMKNGDFFLLDEISLADDSVLERLNSVLEPERTLLLAEKGSKDSNIVASPGFEFLATMNPGGDYGKKELSPALRNRFTEIWVPSMTDDFEDLLMIVQSRLDASIVDYAEIIVNYVKWLETSNVVDVVSLRDILVWARFTNEFSKRGMPAQLCVFHGACMTFIDAIGTNSSAILAEQPKALRQKQIDCVEKLSKMLSYDLTPAFIQHYEVVLSPENLSIGPFTIERIGDPEERERSIPFSLHAPTTARNALRLLRGMQVKKPILLEGSPGVGKTSLVTAVAGITGRSLTRINLSEQTDLIDLFGSDSPVDGGGAGEFVWRDAPFLRAMQQGHWVLLDEMNLASQSVLEGLNACLDHRGETYIPELDRTFKCHPDFTVFAAQNPQYQGGGRKGLPKSFINRFTVVYVDTLSEDDLLLISQYLYPSVSPQITSKLIHFVLELDLRVSNRLFGQLGSPFEFNLRDTMRWLGLLSQTTGLSAYRRPEEFLDLVILNRFRTKSDLSLAAELFHKIMYEEGEDKHDSVPKDLVDHKASYFKISTNYVQAGHSLIKRASLRSESFYDLIALQCNIKPLETAISCVNNSWPLIVIGPQNSGKTSLIRYLASVVGFTLDEFAMNGDIDSMDLLGGFDQVDINHKAGDFWRDLKSTVSRSILMLSLDPTAASSVTNTLFELDRLTEMDSPQLVQAIDLMKSILGSLSEFSGLVEQAEKLQSEALASKTVRFEWFDGILLKAVEQGHWLVLDNANLCNPSVLDRLNSLLEPNGYLTVNECSLPNGEPRIVRPHKDFQLFLTVDPKYGELSRAMRNRGVEIFLDDLEVRATPFDNSLLYSVKKRHYPEEIFADKEPHDLQVAITSQIPQIPLSSVVSQTNTDDIFLCAVADIVEGSGDDLEVLLAGIVPSSLYSNIERLGLTLRSNDLFSARFLMFINKLSGALQNWDPVFMAFIGSCYRSVIDILKIDVTSYVANQTADFGFNSFLTTVMPQSAPGVLLSYIFSLQDLMPFQREGRLIVDSCEAVTSIKHAADMTYLEKSCAKFQGKPLKSSVKPEVFLLLKSIVEFFCKKLLSTEKVHTEELKDLRRISMDIIALTSNVVIDESKLQVYREILEEWLAKYASLQDGDDSQIMLLKQAVFAFGDSLLLKTGTSMQLLWKSNMQELSYPVSAQAWETLAHLKQISVQFDQVSCRVSSESSDGIEGVRNLIIDLLNQFYESTYVTVDDTVSPKSRD